MALHIQRMIKELTACGAAARFLLEAMACAVLQDPNDRTIYSAKALAKQFQLSETLVSAALAELLSVGLVCRLSQVAGRGRPTIRYLLAAGAIATLRANQCPYRLHSQHLQRLFSGAAMVTDRLGEPKEGRKERAAITRLGKPAPRGARGQLSACNRLLLGVLLAHADRFGVVQGVGNVDLRRATGLDTDSLRYRLQRLVALGLVRRWVPGLSSSVFSGGKISSTYYLNLNHPIFAVKSSTAVMVHVARDWDGKRIDHGEILRRDMQAHRSRHGETQSETPGAVIRFLAGQKIEVFELLQHMLLRHASDLLSRHWLDLDRVHPIDAGWLLANIAAALRKSLALEDGQANTELEEVVEHFGRLVFDIAREFKVRFDQVTWIGFEPGCLSILPASANAGYQVITLVLQPPPLGAPECMVLRETRHGVVEPKTWETEAEMPLKDRQFCGLASSPARRLVMG
ncbi:hypothetical protein [Pseudomonas sp. WS 5071]|uniref:hypothetical protein n=1 Tax=Pseudomonas sp. WS 5071 TaxID=2717479 RepID=UPI0014761901|nr:hypothetical protein [Pseudomonas sp. WS 5071]NMY75870.1 hypothetical protein [Pseudomonas sp. WS 5071]